MITKYISYDYKIDFISMQKYISYQCKNIFHIIQNIFHIIQNIFHTIAKIYFIQLQKYISYNCITKYNKYVIV